MSATPARVNIKAQLQQAALYLRNSSPEEWDHFKQWFAAYTTEITVAVTEASAADIMTAKGAALQLRYLQRVFDECDKQPSQPTP